MICVLALVSTLSGVTPSGTDPAEGEGQPGGSGPGRGGGLRFSRHRLHRTELQARPRRVGSTRWPGRRRLSRLQGRTDHAGLVAQAQPHPGRRGRAAILPSAGRVGAYTFAHGVSCHGPSRPTTRTTLRPRDRGPEKPRRGRLPLGSPCGAGSRAGAGREARPRARAGLGALVVSRVEAEVGAAAPGEEHPHPRQERTPALRSDPRGLPASLPAGAWRAGRRLPRAVEPKPSSGSVP